MRLTESVNPRTSLIDRVTTLEMVRLMNAEDARVAPAVAAEAGPIAAAIDAIAARLDRGGRLIYAGAGTSGRLGVLDAAEIPPTFGVPPQRVIAVIAGGSRAITESIEGKEDDQAEGGRDIAALEVAERDSVVGIAASGETPYVVAAMKAARAAGAFVAAVVCNRPSTMEQIAQVTIAPLVGPEVIAGSTRLKAGTAQKMVLNILSTGAMIRLGKTFGNLMVDVQPTNAKLRERARRIVELACETDSDTAQALLAQSQGDVKVAIVSRLAGVSPDQARERLQQANGFVRAALA